MSLSAPKPEDLACKLPDTKAELAALRQQQKAHVAAARKAAYEVKLARQKQIRLEKRAAKLSNQDLLTVFLQRQERCKDKGEASSKGQTESAAPSIEEEFCE